MQTSEQKALIQELRENRDRGIDWSDENFPDWHWRVNPTTLHLGSCASCILGQLTGDFGIGNEKLIRQFPIGATYDLSFCYGFHIDVFSTGYCSDFYQWLTRLWRFTIISRRERDAANNKKETTCTYESATEKQS